MKVGAHFVRSKLHSLLLSLLIPVSFHGQWETESGDMFPLGWCEVWRPETQESQWCKFRLVCRGRRKLMSQLKTLGQEKRILSCSACAPLRLSLAWNRPPMPGRAVILLRLSNLNVNLIENPHTDLSRTLFDQISGHPVTQSTWYTQLTTQGPRTQQPPRESRPLS